MFEHREQIIKDFSKAWEMNDAAHRVEHFLKVEECGLIIADRLDLRFDYQLITYVAFFHDMFAWSRDNHHEMSARWIETTSYPLISSLPKIDKKMVASGCLQHRASFKGSYDGKFSEMMASADREVPGNVARMVERAVQYRIGKGYSRADAMKPAVDHIKEKFSESGYCRYPNMYLEVFGEELAEQRREIRNL